MLQRALHKMHITGLRFNKDKYISSDCYLPTFLLNKNYKDGVTSCMTVFGYFCVSTLIIKLMVTVV